MLFIVIKIVIGTILLIISGMFDAQKDYAKSSISKFINVNLYNLYPFYFYSGSGKDSGWVFKWKNGKHIEGESFKGSSTYNVWKTDWFHFAKKLQIYFFILGFLLLAFVSPYFILIYEIFNHIGFQIAVSSNKYSNLFMYQFHKLGLKVFLKNQNKYNKKLLDEYITNKN